jgi:hypothetical protein
LLGFLGKNLTPIDTDERTDKYEAREVYNKGKGEREFVGRNGRRVEACLGPSESFDSTLRDSLRMTN